MGGGTNGTVKMQPCRAAASVPRYVGRRLGRCLAETDLITNGPLPVLANGDGVRATASSISRATAGNGGGMTTLGKSYLYQWSGHEWKLYQFSWWRDGRS